jgi:predicted FMN-binding regulatory protein PaiB
MEGSWKMAQGLPDADRRAVANALAASAPPCDTEVAVVMTELLKSD